MELNTNFEGDDNLVTIGFKTRRARKNYLSQCAADLGLTLSAYVDSKLLVSEEEEEKNLKVISQLRERLKVFEESRLQIFLKKMKGKVFDFVDEDGNSIHVEVTNVEDVFKILVHSFKFE